MTSATATMVRMTATNARAFHAGARSTPEYACPLRGVDPVLLGSRALMPPSSLFYSARLASPVRGTGVVVSQVCPTSLVTSSSWRIAHLVRERFFTPRLTVIVRLLSAPA
jgi:hypothetical protein